MGRFGAIKKSKKEERKQALANKKSPRHKRGLFRGCGYGIRPVKGKTPDDSGRLFGYTQGGAALRKEVMPMVQFLLDVMAGFLASVLAALVLRHIFRD